MAIPETKDKEVNYIVHPTTGEPLVSAETAEISDSAIVAEDISATVIDGVLYLSLQEAIEWHEEIH